jgi:hypothetical protein
MNEKNRSRERLLADVFHDNWSHGSAASFATAAAAQVRRRRRASLIATAVSTTAALVAVSVLIFRTPPPSNPAPQDLVPYEVISDAQLLELLRDDSVILATNASGKPHILWLNEQPADSAHNEATDPDELL